MTFPGRRGIDLIIIFRVRVEKYKVEMEGLMFELACHEMTRKWHGG